VNIGVFDSGLGGLTIVKTMLQNLEDADIVYIADTKNAPYGEKSLKQIIDFSIKITDYLIDTYAMEVLVVACNTATSAAIEHLRHRYSNLLIVGTEPGLKPAISQSVAKKVGILATPATLNGAKYINLRNQLAQEYDVEVFEQACPGLVQQIESGTLDSPKTISMLHGWLSWMKEAGVDTIVLGCTHYPLVAKVIKEVMGREVNLIETSMPITKRVKELSGIKMGQNSNNNLEIYATGDINQKMVDIILGHKKEVKYISLS